MTWPIAFSTIVGAICAFFVLLETRPGYALRRLVGRWICGLTTGHGFGEWEQLTAVLVEHRICARCGAVEERRLRTVVDWKFRRPPPQSVPVWIEPSRRRRRP